MSPDSAVCLFSLFAPCILFFVVVVIDGFVVVVLFLLLLFVCVGFLFVCLLLLFVFCFFFLEGGDYVILRGHMSCEIELMTMTTWLTREASF